MGESDEEIRQRFVKHLRLVRVTKKSVAISQLESAIMLWFNMGDPASIHTLAVAANDCFHAMGKLKGKPSVFQAMIASQSETFKKRARRAQNFFKHGFRDLKGSLLYAPLYGEMLMFDSVVCYEVIFGPITPLMRAYATRFVLENTQILDPNFMFCLEGLDVDYLAKLDRLESATELLKLFQGT